MRVLFLKRGFFENEEEKDFFGLWGRKMRKRSKEISRLNLNCCGEQLTRSGDQQLCQYSGITQESNNEARPFAHNLIKPPKKPFHC